MGIVVPFPNNRCETNAHTITDYRTDPYYQFIKQVLSVSGSFGHELPCTAESAARQVYDKTNHTSQLAQFIRKQK